MFYSHQLLARKAPLGQIWMAATMHAKINRRKLDKLNIINICEEILNPSVPMALRLSGILMGGVVILYERKVKLLYEDVKRLLVEINEAWKVKAVRDPTIFPKGKSQAKYEAVTLPENQPGDLGEIEQPLQFPNSDTLMKNSYFAMKLDSIDEPYVSHNMNEADLPQDHHQADIADITLCELHGSYQADAGLFGQFERFDIEGDDETQVNFPSHGHTDIPSSLVPSPPPQDEAQIPDEIHEQHHPGDHANHHQSDDGKAQDSPQRQRPPRRRARKAPAPVMDYGQTIIPGQMYQSWLQNTSDIVSRRGRKRKHLSIMQSMKIARLMDLPPVALACGLLTNGKGDIYYPLPLLKQWMRSTQPSHDSPSGKTSPPHPPAPSSSSPPERNDYDGQTRVAFEEEHSGVGSGPLRESIEKERENVIEMPSEILIEEHNVVSGPVAEADLIVTPTNSGGEVRSIPSSGSGHGLMAYGSDVNSARSNKKRLFSSSRRSGSSLEPVADEVSWDHPDENWKLSRLSENGLFVETGTATPTQKVPLPDPPVEKLTDSLRKQLKMHFDTPGFGKTTSVNQLAFGLNRAKAAGLFYQTCVLASRDFIRIEQKAPYGNIFIREGSFLSMLNVGFRTWPPKFWAQFYMCIGSFIDHCKVISQFA